MLYVRASSGELVPLDAVAKPFRQLVRSRSITRPGAVRDAVIQLKPGTSLGEAVERVKRRSQATLPANVTTSFQGTAQAFQSSMRGLGLAALIAIAVIYMVLGILYESFITR